MNGPAGPIQITDLDSDQIIQSNPSIYREVIKGLIATINGIIERAPQKFSGIGMIIYDGEIDHDCFVSLKPDIETPQNIKLGEEPSIDYLCDLSLIDNPAHDGLHLFNEEGHLTHISQYVQPKINRKAKPHAEYGVRYFTSLLASEMPCVVAVGNVTSKMKGFLFRKGTPHQVFTKN